MLMGEPLLQVRTSCQRAGLPAAQADAIVARYAEAQISTFKTALMYVRPLPNGSASDDEFASGSAWQRRVLVRWLALVKRGTIRRRENPHEQRPNR
jgi:hypothetical protein